jgi:hypothetical protein
MELKTLVKLLSLPLIGILVFVVARSGYNLVIALKPVKHLPAFAANHCFVSTGLREPWAVPAEGIVIRVGYLKYLLLFHSEANQSTTRDKIGWEESIADFDAKHVEVPCPATWLSHRSTK